MKTLRKPPDQRRLVGDVVAEVDAVIESLPIVRHASPAVRRVLVASLREVAAAAGARAAVDEADEQQRAFREELVHAIRRAR